MIAYLSMTRLSIALACFFLMHNIIPVVAATEFNREEIINKVTKSLNGEGELIGPVVDYRITEHDKNNGTVTLLVFRGENYDKAELAPQTLPIVYLDSSNEKVITSYAISGKLDRISVIGYIDEQYACFVCFAVRLNIICE